MMKYVARVNKVLHTGIHKLGFKTEQGEMITQNMPLPDYVEIEVSERDAMLYRYQNDGTFCGDTWHEDLQSAKNQAEYEYGISEEEWTISR
jgi:hypothetical protein